MDHSLRGYIGRQPTPVLQTLLQNYTQETLLPDYCYAIPLIVEALTARGVDIPLEIWNRIAEYENRSE